MMHAGRQIDQSSPLLVGVVNLSPESFYKGSVASSSSEIHKKIAQFHQYEVDCLDVGAMSTRPLDIYGGERASIDMEKERIQELLPPLIDIANSYDIPVAIDTQYRETAAIAIEYGVDVINDISGFKTDPQLVDLVADTGIDVVVMAADKKPGDVCGIEETISALESSVQIGLDAGIDRDRIAIDPGFGGWQGRSSSCDLDLLKNFSQFDKFDLPIYVGISRKSTVNTLDGGKKPADRLAGSILLTDWLVDRGANIIRTHDVKETRLALNVRKNLDQL